MNAVYSRMFERTGPHERRFRSLRYPGRDYVEIDCIAYKRD
jgi:hypothetical protein